MHNTAAEVARPDSVNVQPMACRGWRERIRAPTPEKATAPRKEPATFHASWVVMGDRTSPTRMNVLIGMQATVRAKQVQAMLRARCVKASNKQARASSPPQLASSPDVRAWRR